MSCENNVVKKPTQAKTIENNWTSAVWNAGSLSIFPEEIWEYIFNRVRNSADIHAVLLAFPELDRCFQDKKVSWLFDLVLPHLVTKHLVHKRLIKSLLPGVPWKHCINNELLKLRLVSKRWKHAVDFSLETHADRECSYPNETQQNQAARVPANSFSYNRMANYRFGATVFQTGKGVERFFQQMITHKGNPFPGSYVSLQPFASHHFNLLVEKCVELFERFGKYVHAFEIEFSCKHYHKNKFDLFKNILKCLGHTTNLKTLIFTGIDNGDGGGEGFYFVEPENSKLFPKLPLLHTFDWRVHIKHGHPNSMWSRHMIYTYGRSAGIRKLGIDQHIGVMPYFASRLSNLREIHLELGIDQQWNISVIGTILRKLPNKQQLKTLTLSTKKYFRPLIDINDLISELKSFEIESVILEDVLLEEKPVKIFSQVLRSAESMTLKSLYLHDNLKLTYKFLSTLPNLEILHIYFSEEAKVNARENFELNATSTSSFARKFKSYFSLAGSNSDWSSPIAKILRSCLLGAYISDLDVFEHLEFIWKVLPNLKVLSGSVEEKIFVDEYHYGICDVKFARECKNKIFLDRKPNWPKIISHINR